MRIPPAGSRGPSAPETAGPRKAQVSCSDPLRAWHSRDVRWSTLLPLPLLGLFGCPPADAPGTAPDDDDDATLDDDDATPCEYPADAREVMTVGAPLWPYSWPTSSAPDRRDVPVDVREMFCNDGPEDWSPFDVLLFVSIPAW